MKKNQQFWILSLKPYLTSIVLFALLLCSCRVVRNNKQLSDLARTDQEDRINNNPKVSGNDLKRQAAVKRLIKMDSLRTALDYSNAAIVLQHGETSEDFFLANELAKKSIVLNPKNKEVKTLIAQSWDRYLRNSGKPQWYGTQRFKFRGKEYLQTIDTTKVTEQQRKEYGVSTLAQQLDYFNTLYKRQERSINVYIISDSAIAKSQAEEPVKIVGGVAAIYKFIKLPSEALRKGIKGKVLVEFTIDPNGKVKDEYVVSGLGSGCDEEALRVIRSAIYINRIGEDHSMRINVPFE